MFCNQIIHKKKIIEHKFSSKMMLFQMNFKNLMYVFQTLMPKQMKNQTKQATNLIQITQHQHLHWMTKIKMEIMVHLNHNMRMVTFQLCLNTVTMIQSLHQSLHLKSHIIVFLCQPLTPSSPVPLEDPNKSVPAPDPTSNPEPEPEIEHFIRDSLPLSKEDWNTCML